MQRHLALDLLPLIPDEPAQEVIIPSISEVISELASRWVGQQFTLFGSSRPWLEPVPDRAREQLLRRQMDSVISKCLKVTPGRAVHCYRKGALACLAGDAASAKEAFENAGQARGPRNALQINRDLAYARATSELTTLVFNQLDAELQLARFAALAANAMNVGDSSTREKLREQFVGLPSFAFAGLDGKPPVLTVVEELLA